MHFTLETLSLTQGHVDHANGYPARGTRTRRHHVQTSRLQEPPADRTATLVAHPPPDSCPYESLQVAKTLSEDLASGHDLTLGLWSHVQVKGAQTGASLSHTENCPLPREETAMLGPALPRDRLPSPLGSERTAETQQSRWGAHADHRPSWGRRAGRHNLLEEPAGLFTAPPRHAPCAESSDQPHTLITPAD